MKTADQTVVITGASSGIGRATAFHLDALGYRVIAGVRKESDGRALASEASDKLITVILDVTDAASIAAAVAAVSAASPTGLWGLVNNAGLSLNGPLELLPVSQMRKVIDVNLIGLLEVTRAFLPLLRKRRGRIVNISSGHGLLAIPDKSVYAASKFAVQAVSDALRLELHPFGVEVACLAVGKVETEVLGKIVADREAMVREADPEILKLYAPLIEFFDREVRGLPGIQPLEVAKKIAESLRAPKPKPHSLVGPGARKMKNLARLPVGIRDWLLAKTLYSRRAS